MQDPAIVKLNIDRFRRLLAGELDASTRETVARLLAEAQAELGDAAKSPEGGPPSC